MYMHAFNHQLLTHVCTHHTYVIHYCHRDVCCISDIILVEHHLYTIFLSSCIFWHKSVNHFSQVAGFEEFCYLIGEMIDSLVTGNWGKNSANSVVLFLLNMRRHGNTHTRFSGELRRRARRHRFTSTFYSSGPSSNRPTNGVVYFSSVTQLRAALKEMHDFRLVSNLSRVTGYGQTQSISYLRFGREGSNSLVCVCVCVCVLTALYWVVNQIWSDSVSFQHDIKHPQPTLVMRQTS